MVDFEPPDQLAVSISCLNCTVLKSWTTPCCPLASRHGHVASSCVEWTRPPSGALLYMPRPSSTSSLGWSLAALSVCLSTQFDEWTNRADSGVMTLTANSLRLLRARWSNSTSHAEHPRPWWRPVRALLVNEFLPPVSGFVSCPPVLLGRFRLLSVGPITSRHNSVNIRHQRNHG